MNQTAIFWPMIAHAVLIYALYVLISQKRIKAVKAGSARSSQFRENVSEPPESLFVRNNMTNQFELPMLFYPVCFGLFVTDGVTVFTFILACLFVVSRYIHTWIHVTTNRIRHRRPIFIVGFFILGALWITFAVQLLFGA